MSHFQLLSGPSGLGDILDGAFRLYRARFVQLANTAAIFLAPMGVIAVLLVGAHSSSLLPQLTVVGGRPLTDLVTWLGYCANSMAFMSLTVQIDWMLGGVEPALGKTIGRAARRFLSFAGMAIILVIVIGGISLLAFFIVGMAMPQARSNYQVFIVTGFALVMIPLLFLAGRWLLAPTVLVSEQLGPIAALWRSWDLTRGCFWRTLAYFILLTILNTIVVVLPMTLIPMLVPLILPAKLVGWGSGLMVGMGYFADIIWYPFVALAQLLFYYDLRIRNEGFDLELQIRGLEESQQSTPPE